MDNLSNCMCPAFDKIVKNAWWRKHGKLVQQCKVVIEKLATGTPEGAGEKSILKDDGKFYSIVDADIILEPLIDACDSQVIKIAEPALECLLKLIVHGHFVGEMDSGKDPASRCVFRVLCAACRCHSLADETVEALILEIILCAVNSISLIVHGSCLLRLIGTCYTLFLKSRFLVNQNIAKASLIQMLLIVFRRMETGSCNVGVQPIVVADFLELSPEDNGVKSVQNFIIKSVESVGGVVGWDPSTRGDDGTHSLSSSFEVSECGDKEMLDADYWQPNSNNNEEPQQMLKFQRDALLVLQTLCKLSMKTETVSPSTSLDILSLRGKIVALELQRILMGNIGVSIRANDWFSESIKKCLCLSLVRNCSATDTTLFRLACSIFMNLVLNFRTEMKAEIEIFFPMIILRVLENSCQSNYQQKMVVVHVLQQLSEDSHIFVDLFLNYDCDVDSSNIFERIINGLLKTLQGAHPGLTALQVSALKLASLRCLVGVVKSVGDWMNGQLHATHSPYLRSFSPDTGHTDVPGTQEKVDEAVEDAGTFEKRRAYKLELQEGIALFNRKPRKGVDFLIRAKKLGNSPEEVAKFLLCNAGLDKTMIGDYLGDKEDFALKVMHAYVDSFDFQGMEFDESIRTFLSGFRLPGEAQKIDRVMEKFAERYCICNPNAFTSADTAYVLAYSVIMLNTDAHNPMVKEKMSKLDFIKNNKGIDNGKDLPEEFMGALYNRIVKKEIKMKDDNFPSATSTTVSAHKFPSIDDMLHVVLRKRKDDQQFNSVNDAIEHMQRQLENKIGKSRSIYYAPSDLEILKPIIEVSWAPMLAAFSVYLDETYEDTIIELCLEGYRHAIHVTAVLCLETQRDAFITSIAKLTSLHSPTDIQPKSILAIKAILSLAQEDGNYLREAWEHVLTCISRFENLHLIGEGSLPDATFLSASQTTGEMSLQANSSSGLKRKGNLHLAAVAKRGSYESGGLGWQPAGDVTEEQLKSLALKLSLLEQVDTFEVNKIFTDSERLHSEAIVEFVKALCKVSMDELRSHTNPRVFGLTKIVEISHFNMNRIRLVWNRIWNVLSNYFITVGCSENLAISMYAMDSLRQLAMKFLEREELANYNFQNQFMKPFVVVMQKSNLVEIRELIIRCVSQMIYTRVGNIKSGWKILFMVFTTAATDRDKNIVLLAFETIEKIVREYFTFITETEAATFTDCVNCLLAFTNNKHSIDVSLNAIAFLRFCAFKLAQGDLSVSAKNKDNGRIVGMSSRKESLEEFPVSADKYDHLYFWFPLLAGLSELTFDSRPDIRKSALEVLFNTLHDHGHLFSPGLWNNIFYSIIFPIFDHARYAIRQQDFNMEQQQEIDSWHYNTCVLALHFVLDLYPKFYVAVHASLEKMLCLLVQFIKRPHENLAGICIASLVQLVGKTGHHFRDEDWELVVSALRESASGTFPNMGKIVEILENGSDQSRHKRSKIANLEGCIDKDVAHESKDARMRKLGFEALRMRCHITVQLLLTQAINEIFDTSKTRISTKHAMLLLDILDMICENSQRVARGFYGTSNIGSLQHVMDPRVLRLENDSYQAYLSLLQKLPGDIPGLMGSPGVERRLVTLCLKVLNRYIDASHEIANRKKFQPLWIIPLSSTRRQELTARAPLVISTLKAISSFETGQFKRYINEFFPLLVNLISCEHGSREVQEVLRHLYSALIGPIILQAS